MNSLISKLRSLSRRRKLSPEEKSLLARIMSNPLLVSHILRFLDNATLKTARLVCKTWAKEGAIQMSGVRIRLQPPYDMRLSQEFSTFLAEYRIPHTLFLSFTSAAWAFNQRYEDPLGLHLQLNHYYAPRTVGENEKQLVHNYLRSTFAWVAELRLEIHLNNQQDATFLMKLLSRLTCMKKLSLDFVNFGADGLKAVTCENLLPPSVQSMGLRCHHGSSSYYSKLTFSGCMQFMKACCRSNLACLDLIGWQQDHSIEEKGKIHWLEALTVLCRNDKLAFQRLTGLRQTIHFKTEVLHLLSLQRRLTHLYAFCHQWPFHGGVSRMKNVAPLITRNSATLHVLDLYWFVDKAIGEFHSSVTLPFLPLLSRLIFTCGAQLKWDGWTMEMFDVLDIRNTLLGGPERVALLLPSLTTICMFLFREDGLTIWKYLFPQTNRKGFPLTFRQIHFLGVSLVAECDSSEIRWFYTLFPSLKLFRHVKREGNNAFAGCEHRLEHGHSYSTSKLGCALSRKDHLDYAWRMGYQLRWTKNDPCLWY